jgi:peptidoglycan hydrolase FlgJ
MADSQTLPAADLSQRFALDTQGFDALRAQAAASPSTGLKQVSKQFDAMFIEMMLKSMRDATPADGVLDSNDSKQYTAMLDQQLAQQLSSRGIGVAEALTRQLMVNGHLPTGSAGGSGSSALPGLGSGAGMGADAGLSGAGDSDANAGSMEAMNALAKAYANAAQGRQNAALGEGQGWSGNDALKPSLKDSGSAQASAFVDALASPAQAASEVTGIPARYILGQAALESGWGRREIRGNDGARSYNVFNIKAGHGWTGRTVTAMTTEYVNGVAHRVPAQFRAYGSYAEAMTDYASFLKSNPRYASVLGASHDDAGFAQGMQQAGYATDPHYARKLLSVIRQLI